MLFLFWHEVIKPFPGTLSWGMDSKHCSYQTSPNQRVAKSRPTKNRKIPVRKRMVTLMKTGMTWINAVKRGRRTAVQRSRWLSVFYSYFIFQYIIQNILYLLSVCSCALYQCGKLQWPCGSTWSRPFPRTQCGDWQQGFFLFFTFFFSFYSHLFIFPVVFMGSEKYPDENGFDAFLKKHGGSDNASTDCERTIFQFDVQKKYFKDALDRWAKYSIISHIFIYFRVNCPFKILHLHYLSTGGHSFSSAPWWFLMQLTGRWRP